MSLASRAALSVPLIALIIAILMAVFAVLTEPEDSLIKGWGLAQIMFGYTALFALPTGAILSFPAVLFGHLLPHPRWAWFIGIGAVISIILGRLFFGSIGISPFELVVTFASVGALSAALWWTFVERHREKLILDA